ncbi:MAG TPA: hypothetical protein VFQ63_03375 [Patescibacteria group bacterium]|nr:hypothetical protein [Patescibacteria group bacterium]
MKLLHNPKVLIGIAAGVFIILIGVGAYFLLSAQKPAGPTLDQVQQQTVFPTIVPSDLGLTFEAKPGNQYVRFTIANASDITHVSYEISYDAIATADEGGDGSLVSQGLNGEINQPDIKNGKAGIDWRILGTCSTGGKCRFDQGVKQVHLLLKITKKDGKIYQAESSLTL